MSTGKAQFSLVPGEGLPDVAFSTREGLVQDLMTVLKLHRRVGILAPPFSGKSAVGQLVYRSVYCATEFSHRKWISFSSFDISKDDINEFVKRGGIDLEAAIKDENTLLIFDEAQTIFSKTFTVSEVSSVLHCIRCFWLTSLL